MTDFSPLPAKRKETGRAIFDKAHPSLLAALAANADINHSDAIFGAFRKTAAEKAAPPPRRVRTAELLGDPLPGRVVPDLPEETGSGRWTEPRAPVYLTFAAMRAGYGLDENGETPTPAPAAEPNRRTFRAPNGMTDRELAALVKLLGEWRKRVDLETALGRFGHSDSEARRHTTNFIALNRPLLQRAGGTQHAEWKRA